MTGRQIGAVAGIVLGAIGCMKADRVVAVQNDVVQMDGGDDAAWGRGPFSAPTVVAGLAAADTDVHGASLTQDELEIYFSCARKGEASFHIWTSTRASRDAKWNTATMPNELVGPADDADPDVSWDGLTIYFASNRSSAGFGLYVAQRIARDQPWVELAAIQELSPPTMDRYGPSVDPDGLFMAFGSAPLGKNGYRLYSASRSDTASGWGNVRELSGINSGKEDNDPALFHASLSLVWSSRAPSNGASWDLVEVSRSDPSTPFSAAPIRLDSLNTGFSERYPWVSQDGTHILFSREPEGSPGVIYEAWR
ncbi:MAG TPA: hypothetical protein VJ860_10280 [Polyangia bacterium]|jgi:WD40-like Beta Propeller Repeat.|nr:hypothetical protein [Polyangia bacterium]